MMLLRTVTLGSMALGPMALGPMALGPVALGPVARRNGAQNTWGDTLFEFFQLKVQVSHLFSPPFWLSSVEPLHLARKNETGNPGRLRMARFLFEGYRK